MPACLYTYIISRTRVIIDRNQPTARFYYSIHDSDVEYYENLEPGTYVMPAHPKVKSGKVMAKAEVYDPMAGDVSHVVESSSSKSSKVYYYAGDDGSKSGKSDSKSGKAFGGSGGVYYGSGKSGKAYGDSKSAKSGCKYNTL